MAEASAPIEVAVGILRDPRGCVLIGERTAGRAYAGYWEFPGGKLEPGESAEQALVREFDEELGTVVRAARPLIRLRHDYPEYSVRLSVFEITDWAGEPRSVEGQRLAWVAPEALDDWKLLPADAPLVAAIRLPREIAVSPPGASAEDLLAGLPSLPPGAALRLRDPARDDGSYARVAEALLPACRAAGRQLILDRGEALSRSLGEPICMVRAAESARPDGLLRGVSVHDAAECEAASGADFLVLGPVAATPTHPGAEGLGWDAAARLIDSQSKPVYLIGGLRRADLERAVSIGAQGIAGIRCYWS